MTTRILLAVLAIVVATSVTYAEESASLISPEVEKAALAQEWEQVAMLSKDLSPNSGSAVQRLLMGHAYLARNRNNESFRLFAAATPADLEDWERWSGDLAKRYPRNSSAHFFHADALARLDKYDEALVAFSRSLKFGDQNPYALHGRGVLRAQMGDYGDAGKDLAAAQSAAPSVAEFHNSRGMLRIAQRQGRIEKLKRRFERATELSEDFALAFHALGCLELLRNPQSEIHSNEHLLRARSSLPEATPLFVANESAYELEMIELLASAVGASVEDEEAGAYIRTEVKIVELVDRYRKLDQSKTDLNNATGLQRIGTGLPKAAIEVGKSLIARSIAGEFKNMSPAEVQQFRNRNGPDVKITILALKDYGNQPLIRADRSATSAVTNVTKYLDRIDIGRSGIGIGLDMKQVQSGLQARSQQGSRADLDLGIKVNQLRGADLYRQKVDGPGINTPNVPNLTIQKFSPGPAIDAQPGGATMDRSQVVWGQKAWPFQPLFGLLYLPATDPEITKDRQ